MNGVYFQIDTLLVSPYFALNLEIKNWAGEISFKKNFCQVTQEKDGKINTYANPISQAKLQVIQLKEWCKQNHFVHIPIDFLVVMSNSNTRLKSDPGYTEAFQKVIHSIRLNEKVEEIEKRYKQLVFDEFNLKKLKEKVLAEHTPQWPNVLKMFSLTHQDIPSGVQCPFCNHIPMNKCHRKWFCNSCKNFSKEAYKQAVEDYFLLISAQITNQQARKFLQVRDNKMMYLILNAMNLPFIGTKKGRIYQHPSYIPLTLPDKNQSVMPQKG
ncbi:nuclease-related domain-containing protein [Bacillus sp. EB01]|uniref:nuclease-related domain-containing protein n=1 Tax=Bacillus sp. EB01 TaxID=1347086 RepID=UPI0005C5BC22|nr:nuclease-related domain-containing protein [Bacillus sp. EB01]